MRGAKFYDAIIEKYKNIFMFEEKWCYKWWDDEKVQQNIAFILDDREGSEYLMGFFLKCYKKEERGKRRKDGKLSLRCWGAHHKLWG